MTKKQMKLANGSVDGCSDAAASDYKVGRGRPPKHSQFKPGQSGNPNGRPRGSANASTIVERALNRKVSVRKGDKKQTMTTLEAITESYSLKAVQGDRHAANFVLNLGTKTGVIAPNQDEPAANDQTTMPAVQVKPSETILAGVHVQLLTRSELGELSRLLELIDNSGDVIDALEVAQFARLQHLLGKGRGKILVAATGSEGGAP
jgi:hypothetical protein